MDEFRVCDQHSGHRENIRELCEFKRSMTASGIGTIDRIWTAVENKVSRGLLVAFAIIVVGLMGTLFGLVYHSNKTVLQDMVGIKVNIQLIMEKLK